MGKNQAGFNLIELMIVVVIIVILATIAFPNYRQYVQRSNRTDAKASLLRIASEQEKFFMQNNRYTNDFSPAGLDMDATSEEGYYNLNIAAGATGNINTSFVISATPVAGERQADDGPCQTFSLSDQNVRNSAPDGPDICWR